MMDSVSRRRALRAVGATFAALSLTSRSFAQTRRPVVAMYISQSRQAQAVQIDAFLQRMKELGYVEGQTFTFEFRSTDGFPERADPLTDEIAQMKSDVIVSGGGGATGPAATMAKKTSTIPIIVPNLALNQTNVKNPARPEGNVTGIIGADYGDKEWFELAKELVPGATLIGRLVNVGGADAGAAEKASNVAAAAATGVKVVFGEAKSADEAEAAFQSLVAQRVQVAIAGTGIFNVARGKLIPAAKVARLPLIYGVRDPVPEGALISLGPDQRAGFRRAAELVDLVLKGAKPADLPVEKQDAFVLAINLNTAKEMGFTFPTTVLARANEKIGA